ncbi:MAG: phosphatidate cytidylyltransferase [Rudaea sp.]
MKQRIITALLITPFAIALILFTPTVALGAIIAALCLIALWEWTRLSGMRSRPLRAVLVALALALMITLWIDRGSMFWWATIGVGVVWWFFALFWLKHYSFAAALTRANVSIKLLAGFLAIIPAWVALMSIHLTQPDIHTWALYSLLLIWGADTFAYIAGKRWGRKKLAPNISPGKTIAGVYGALVGSAIVAAVGGWLLNVRGMLLIALIVVALVSVLFSVVGDLFESVIKRHANVKDSGALFPGHGGVFDRLDGVFAALPIFALGKYLLGL